ncbi:MAG: helix-turn-helix domain-containing protein [bacterium]|nr:helix-turn-helix domain-containing protein [bacterium]
MAANKESSIMTAKEVANCLGLYETRVYRLSQRGLIPAYRVGGSWRFQKDEIEE